MDRSNQCTVEPNFKREPAAKRLLKAAGDLFYRYGIRAVGVDEIVKAAGVAKISLYRAFSSKDALIVAYLKNRDAAFWSGWDEAVAGTSDPEVELRAVIAMLTNAIANPDYRGCPFANFASEFPEREHDGRLVVEASRRELRKRLTDICCRLPVSGPRSLADGLFLMIEGAFTASQTVQDGRQFVCRALKAATDTLLAAQMNT